MIYILEGEQKYFKNREPTFDLLWSRGEDELHCGVGWKTLILGKGKKKKMLSKNRPKKILDFSKITISSP